MILFVLKMNKKKISAAKIGIKKVPHGRGTPLLFRAESLGN